ncbi:hypothetical protein M6B38_103295 [Iris pallida]|uniref:Uncharacterized protein n=1 Tax=Iris pallida TaxID=29817 RepID=A0AAX6FBX6_IRIPA|nr:hypothetical protein M6B38_103295 [Iris pallida]
MAFPGNDYARFFHGNKQIIFLLRSIQTIGESRCYSVELKLDDLFYDPSIDPFSSWNERIIRRINVEIYSTDWDLVLLPRSTLALVRFVSDTQRAVSDMLA